MAPSLFKLTLEVEFQAADSDDFVATQYLVAEVVKRLLKDSGFPVASIGHGVLRVKDTPLAPVVPIRPKAHQTKVWAGGNPNIHAVFDQECD